MTDEKPLRVQVAEALGWFDVHQRAGGRLDKVGEWCGHDPTRPVIIGEEAPAVPPYGEDSPEGWACTGPLVERFGIHLGHAQAQREGRFWITFAGDLRTPDAKALGHPTACEAIARCVVALAAAGKLQR